MRKSCGQAETENGERPSNPFCDKLGRKYRKEKPPESVVKQLCGGSPSHAGMDQESKTAATPNCDTLMAF